MSKMTTIKKSNLDLKMQQADQSHHHAFDLGGTIRNKTIEETTAALNPLLKKAGITRVADIGGLDKANLPVAVAIRPNAKHLCGAQGKGITKDLARISAIMEAIESYHMENPPDPLLFGNFDDLSISYPVLDPYIFPLANIAFGNLKQKELSWVRGLDLANQKEAFIPHALINLDSSTLSKDLGLFSVTTNGLAAGNTINEAISHGLHEIIERDAVYHWLKRSRAERDTTKLDLSSIQSKNDAALIKKLTDSGLKLEIWETPSVIGIPAYYCVIYEVTSLGVQGAFHGSGCHLVSEIALSRAVTEAIQSRVTFISGSRDDIYPHLYEKQRLEQEKIIQQASAMQPGQKNFNDVVSNIKHSESFLENINAMVSALGEKSYQHVLVFDHTKSDFNIPIVQVFVPGLKNSGGDY